MHLQNSTPVKQPKQASDLLSLRQQSAGGGYSPSKPYPRQPFPKIEALLIDPDTRTVRTVFLRATANGLRSIFGEARVTYTDKPFLRAYGTNQYHTEVTNRATLPKARLSVQGKVLVTGPGFTNIIWEVSQEIIRSTTFSRGDAHTSQ